MHRSLRIRGSVIALSVLALAACTSQPVQPAQAGPGQTGSGTCKADAVQWAVGQAGEQATLGRIWRESGAGLLRPIGPGQAVTRDFRADRVNVELDAKNVVTRVTCG